MYIYFTPGQNAAWSQEQYRVLQQCGIKAQCLPTPLTWINRATRKCKSTLHEAVVLSVNELKSTESYKSRTAAPDLLNRTIVGGLPGSLSIKKNMRMKCI